MGLLLVTAVVLLAFANGSNDNFKGVATLWGATNRPYYSVLGWATLCTFAGSLLSAELAAGLVQVFNGSRFLGSSRLHPIFLLAVALGGISTVLVATLVGMPVSTTHALVGALVGAGLLAVGPADVRWGALASSIALPLLFSPLAALGLTLSTFPLLARWLPARSCLCPTQPAPVPLGVGETMQAARGFWPGFRFATTSDCTRGDELARWNTEGLVHWSSAGLISFSRGLNDTPKIAALLLSIRLLPTTTNYALVGLGMAIGGLVAARRVARTMSRRVTNVEALPGMSANLVSALLVGLASRWGLPVSTTHVTMGGIFGVGLRRHEQTNWNIVRQILLAWVFTAPLGLTCGLGFYRLLTFLH